MSSDAKLILRLDRAVEPIAGEITDETGSPRSFVGWVELVAVIEAARGPTPTESAIESERLASSREAR